MVIRLRPDLAPAPVERLKTLAGQIASRTGQDVKVFVDTAPLMEKPLAQRAGLGWQGKHTNLLSRTHGNWLFLGVILSAAELTPDEPEAVLGADPEKTMRFFMRKPAALAAAAAQPALPTEFPADAAAVEAATQATLSAHGRA